ncbi:MAG: hypothetical protein AAFP93_02730 [Bacteroidota bacterium]
MEDVLNILLYVGVAIIYWWFKSSDYAWKDTKPVEAAKPPTEATNQPARWKQLERTYSTPKPIQPLEVRSCLQPSTTALDTATPTKLLGARSERILAKYGGWKQGIVMSEILRPISLSGPVAR